MLRWEFRKELFGKLAWGQGLGAANDIFVYMVRSGCLSRGGLGMERRGGRAVTSDLSEGREWGGEAVLREGV